MEMPAETRAALRRYTARACWPIAAGLALAIVGGGLLRMVGGEGSGGADEQAAGWVGVMGFLLIAFGLVVFFNALRMWVWLRRHPWQPWPSRFRVLPGLGNGSPTLVLTREEDGREFVLSVVGVKWRWKALDDCDRGEVWMAGDPTRGGVVAPPGGTHLLWARRPLLARRRESLRHGVLDEAGGGPPSEPDRVA
jgi:hypothetical protein